MTHALSGLTPLVEQKAGQPVSQYVIISSSIVYFHCSYTK